MEGLVAGTYYAPSVLPLPLQLLGAALPQTYALDALRRLLIAGSARTLIVHHYLPSINPVLGDVAVLALLSSTYIPWDTMHSTGELSAPEG